MSAEIPRVLRVHRVTLGVLGPCSVIEYEGGTWGAVSRWKQGFGATRAEAVADLRRESKKPDHYIARPEAK